MSNNIFIGVSCRPMSSDQDRIRTSRWWSSTKLDDDQNMMFRSDDTPRDDVTNVVSNIDILSARATPTNTSSCTIKSWYLWNDNEIRNIIIVIFGRLQTCPKSVWFFYLPQTRDTAQAALCNRWPCSWYFIEMLVLTLCSLKVVNNAPARPSSGAVSSSDSRALPVEPFFEDYALLPLNKNNECQYCEGCAFYEELEVAANYGKIILATMGVLILMFLLIYVLYSCSCCCCCHHGPDDEISKPPTTNIRDHSTVVRKKVKFDIWPRPWLLVFSYNCDMSVSLYITTYIRDMVNMIRTVSTRPRFIF